MQAKWASKQQQRRKIIWWMPKIIYFNSSCSHCEATITCLSRFFLRELLTAAQRFYESYCRVVQNNLLSMIVSLSSGIWITRWRWLWWSLSCALIWVEQSPSPIQPDWSRERDYTKGEICNLIHAECINNRLMVSFEIFNSRVPNLAREETETSPLQNAERAEKCLHVLITLAYNIIFR